MDVEVTYYDAVEEEFVDLTPYLTAYRVQDEGISKVGSGIVNLESVRSDFTDFLSNPYRLIRIRNNPSSWYPIFFGYVDDCHVRTLPGTVTERSKISLDLLGYEAKLAQEYITFDYYKHQSAISPLADANAYSYRDMMEAYLTYPDSTRDGTGLSGTGFEIEAVNNPSGIDAIIDGSCNWHKQSLFEATRIVCEHIGYDGYFPKFTNVPFTPTINLYPYSKNSIDTIEAPFIEEPQYSYGSLNDVANIAFIWGGIDAGIPADGDRLTEWAVTKYTPYPAWTANALDGDTAITDADNTIFNEGLRANNKCVKMMCDSLSVTNEIWAEATLDIANTEYLSVDALNRCSGLTFALKLLSDQAILNDVFRLIRFKLTDTTGNAIFYTYPSSLFHHYWQGNPELNIDIPLNDQPIATSGTGISNIGKWAYAIDGSTTFDWEHIQTFTCRTTWRPNYHPADDWGFAIDGLQFVGGMQIKPFERYSETLNPPVQDAASIAAYGMHPIHIQDTTISSFDQAQAEGARVIQNLKDPKPTLSIKKVLPETTQLYPSNVVTVASTEYRIKNITYNWKYGDRKVTNVEYGLIGKTASLPPIWTMINELRFLVK